jgi:hypothetical protein
MRFEEHEDYIRTASQWRRCADVFAGSDAVKAAGQLYLPRVSEAQSDRDYARYLEYAQFTNAMARSVLGFQGQVLRKPFMVSAPDRVRPHLEDVTLSSVPFDLFAARLLEQVLVKGRVGVLVDFNERAVGAASPLGRPVWLIYHPESIVDWSVHNFRVTRLVLRERVQDETTEPDGTPRRTHVEQYAVYELDDVGALVVTVWRRSGANSSGEFQIVDIRYPTRFEARLDFIPFHFFGPTGITPDIEKPPLLDLVDVNLSHYRSSADLEWARHFLATPTPYVCGVSGVSSLKVGSSVAWSFPNSDTKVGMLEFSGAGLSELRLAIEQKQAQMAWLGSRLIETRATFQEAAETVRLRQAGESSALATMANTLGRGLADVLRTHAWWMGASDLNEIRVTANTDFDAQRMTGEEAVKLMALWQAGGISHQTLYYALERGELTRPGVVFDEERQTINAESDLETAGGDSRDER